MSLLKAYKKQQFIPQWYSVFINPYFIIRWRLYKALKSLTPALHGKMMDFGCGAKPYQSIIKVNEYIGVDIENEGHSHQTEEIDVFYDGKTIPFESNTFDSVFSSEVFEHVFNLNEMLVEINRVLKPNGVMIFSTPFVWNEHETPYDFGRYSRFGLASIMGKTGFVVEKTILTTHFAETLCQLFITYIYELFTTKNKYVNIAIAFILSPLNIVLILLSFLLPRKRDLYHNVVMQVKKTSDLI